MQLLRQHHDPEQISAISAFWPNMVEGFFQDLTTQRPRRGVFTSVPELVSAIDAYVAPHNRNPKPVI